MEGVILVSKIVKAGRHYSPTSTASKREWNKRNYDSLHIKVPKGARVEIHAAARAHGMSMAEYIRHLILADNPEECPILGGGGGQYPKEIRHLIDRLTQWGE